MEFHAEVAEIKEDVAVLTRENALQGRLLERFETVVDRIQVLTESMNRMIVVHEERIKYTASAVDQLKVDMNKEIRDLEQRITSETDLLSRKIDQSEIRILEKIAELKKEWNDEKSRATEKKEAFSDKLGQVALKFESWKWFIIGGVFAAGLLMGKSNLISGIFSIFKMP